MKKTYILELWGRGGEMHQYDLTREGHAIAMQDDSWLKDFYSNVLDDHVIFQSGFKDIDFLGDRRWRNEMFYDNNDYEILWGGLNINHCNLNIYEINSKNERNIVHKNINAKDAFKCDGKSDYYKSINNDEYEKLDDDEKGLMEPRLTLYQEQEVDYDNGNCGELIIELDEVIDLSKIYYEVAGTNFGDIIDSFYYKTDDNEDMFELYDGPEFGEGVENHCHIGWYKPPTKS
jgi:hypothetical protein